MKKVSEDILVVKFDGVNVAGVYLGSVDELIPAKLTWRIDEEMKKVTGFGEILTLKEIAEQCNSIVTVFCESPFDGIIYQYGNYGDEWWEIGTLGGYA